MSDLTWLRRRIWIAVALPLAAGCSKSDERSAAPAQRDAATVAKRPDAAPPLVPDAAPPAAPDATPPPPPDAALPPDAAPKPAGKWTVENRGCAGESWCAPPKLAATWAASKAREEGCPAAIIVPPKGTAGRPTSGAAVGKVTFSLVDDNGKCCYRKSYGGACKGRPFLDDDQAIVAELPAGDDPGGWLAAALDEHASIASFARATLELLAVGAPPSLIAGCQQAALDELAHAQGCFAMAARHGRAAEPGPLPALAPRGGGLAGVARDTFVEGCVGETLGAAIAAAARDAAVDPEERALLARIADDEARHAALAWQTVAWTLRALRLRSGQSDVEVVTALRAAADRARGAVVDELAIAAWRDVIDPTLAELLAA